MPPPPQTPRATQGRAGPCVLRPSRGVPGPGRPGRVSPSRGSAQTPSRPQVPTYRRAPGLSRLPRGGSRKSRLCGPRGLVGARQGGAGPAVTMGARHAVAGSGSGLCSVGYGAPPRGGDMAARPQREALPPRGREGRQQRQPGARVSSAVPIAAAAYGRPQVSPAGRARFAAAPAVAASLSLSKASRSTPRNSRPHLGK